MRVVGIRVELPGNQPVVLLREEDGPRYLPIWIGAVEASAIAFQQQGVQTVRPLTHDLLKDVIDAFGAQLEEVHITEMRDDIYFAELRFTGGVSVSARPSDAIALALRTGTPILGTDDVLDAAGIEIDDAAVLDSEEAEADADDQVERFREFLDSITPEDFAAGE
jgi:bifunctional DNase/RNase